MSIWAIVLVVVAAWIVFSMVVALVVARAIKLRDVKNRAPGRTLDPASDHAASSGPDAVD